MDSRDYEIWRARQLLEERGFIVRKPGDADAPVRVRIVEQGEGRAWHLPIRLDTEINGQRLALGEHFPVEMILDEQFRKQAMPQIYARKLGHYIADRLLETLGPEMERALAPMLAAAEEARDRMSLPEIQEFISRALHDPSFDADKREGERLSKRARNPKKPLEGMK